MVKRSQRGLENNYPYYLPWKKARWIVKEGDKVEIDNEEYVVTRVKLKPIPGRPPDITVKSESLIEKEREEKLKQLEESEPRYIDEDLPF